MTQWAEHFREIPDTIEENREVQNKIIEPIDSKPIHGKAIEGADREEKFRDILDEFFSSNFGFQEAYRRVAQDLPRNKSPHAHNNRVFSSDWNERLIRTQVSRFYNQGVLHVLQERGDTNCFIPHSPEEYPDSECTIQLAGNEAEVDTLLNRLEKKFDQADYDTPVTVPGRPNCTHTVVPVEYTDQQ